MTAKTTRLNEADQEITMSHTKTLSKALAESVLSFVSADMPDADKIENVKKSFVQFAGAMDEVFAPIVEFEKGNGAMSFQEAASAASAKEAISQAMKPIYIYVAALEDSITSVMADPTIQDKAAAIQDTVGQFDEAIAGAIAELTGAQPEAEEMGEQEMQEGAEQQDGPAKVEAPEAESQQVDDAKAQDQTAAQQPQQPQRPQPQPEQQQAQQPKAEGEEDPEKKRNPFAKSDDGEETSFAKSFAPDIEEIYAELKKGAELESEDDFVRVSKAFLANVAVTLDHLYGEAIQKSDAFEEISKARKNRMSALRAHLDMANQHMDEMEKDEGFDEPYEMAKGEGEGVTEENLDMIGKSNTEDKAVTFRLDAEVINKSIADALAPLQEQFAKASAEKDAVIASLTARLEKMERQPKDGGAILIPQAAHIKKSDREPTFVPKETDTGLGETFEMMKGAQADPVFKPLEA